MDLDEPLLPSKASVAGSVQATVNTEMLAMGDTASQVDKDKPPSASTPMVAYSELFRFATKRDIVLMLLGTGGALASGAILVH
jgi:uncharacterized alpha/beta hydrolase family protein